MKKILQIIIVLIGLAILLMPYYLEEPSNVALSTIYALSILSNIGLGVILFFFCTALIVAALSYSFCWIFNIKSYEKTSR